MASALLIGCQFGSTGASASGGMPGDGTGPGDDGAPTTGPSGDDDGGPDDGAPTSADDGGPTSGDDGSGTTPADDGDSTGAPPIEPAPWWDPAWSHRAELVIHETADGPLPTEYSVVLHDLDTQAMIDAGQLLDTHADLRVVRWDGATSTELARRLQRELTPGLQRMWWKTRAEVVEQTDGEYWLYWGNPDAGKPPEAWVDSMAGTSEIYLAGDDFEEHEIGDCPDGWGACAPEWSVQTVGNGMVMRGISPVTDLLLTDYVPTGDVVVQARVRNQNPAGCPGIVTAVNGATWLRAGYGCEIGAPVPGVSLQLVQNSLVTTLVSAAASQMGEWRTVTVVRLGDEVTLMQDGVAVGTADASLVPVGGIGLSAQSNVAAEFDDVLVRKIVVPGPEVELGPEETAP